MASNPKTEHLTVFGGTGFLGHEIVKHLVAEGHFAHVASRHPENVDLYEDSDGGGRVIPVYADVRDETSVALAINGSDAVINAVGLYVEEGAMTFEAVHEIGALNVAPLGRDQSTGSGLEQLGWPEEWRAGCPQ